MAETQSRVGAGKRPAPPTAFKPGQSGNPGGRKKIPEDVKEAARALSVPAINTLKEVMSNKKAPPAARVSAANSLLDRAWGRPDQKVDMNLWMQHFDQAIQSAADILGR